MAMRYSWAFAVLLQPLILPDSLFSQTDFYQGKTVTVIASTAPGGTGDMRVKAVLPFLRKHILGNPTLVIEYSIWRAAVAAKQRIIYSVTHDLTGLPWVQ